MGCQDILENVPGRSKATSVALPGWSPSDNRSSFMSRTSKSKSGSSRNLLKTDDLSSSVTILLKSCHTFEGPSHGNRQNGKCPHRTKELNCHYFTFLKFIVGKKQTKRILLY